MPSKTRTPGRRSRLTSTCSAYRAACGTLVFGYPASYANECPSKLRKEVIDTKIILGIILIFHGLIHLLYAGQSAGRFELRPGLAWPGGSWVFGSLPVTNTVRGLAAAACIAAAIGFVVGAAGLFTSQGWWRMVTVGTAAFSALVFLVLWDGKMHALADKGIIAVLINAAIIVALLVLRWPRV